MLEKPMWKGAEVGVCVITSRKQKLSANNPQSWDIDVASSEGPTHYLAVGVGDVLGELGRQFILRALLLLLQRGSNPTTQGFLPASEFESRSLPDELSDETPALADTWTAALWESLWQRCATVKLGRIPHPQKWWDNKCMLL